MRDLTEIKARLEADLLPTSSDATVQILSITESAGGEDAGMAPDGPERLTSRSGTGAPEDICPASGSTRATDRHL
jgi:hypothetical protein